eukprot:Pgem_evm1s544
MACFVLITVFEFCLADLILFIVYYVGLLNSNNPQKIEEGSEEEKEGSQDSSMTRFFSSLRNQKIGIMTENVFLIVCSFMNVARMSSGHSIADLRKHPFTVSQLRNPFQNFYSITEGHEQNSKTGGRFKLDLNFYRLNRFFLLVFINLSLSNVIMKFLFANIAISTASERNNPKNKQGYG